jgi:hypothetical protein
MAIQVEKEQKYELGKDNSVVPIYSDCFNPPLLDQICFSISYDTSYPTQIIVDLSYGTDTTEFKVDIADFACIPIGIPDVADLQICFDNWQVESDYFSFNISFQVCLILCVTVYSIGPIIVPTSMLGELKKGQLSAENTEKVKQFFKLQQYALQQGKKTSCSCNK